MAESDFNFGPNFPPGGAPENPRVNSAAFDTEAKRAQQLQIDTIKNLTETINDLTKKYEELNNTTKKLSVEEIQASNLLRDKISALNEVLTNVRTAAATGAAPSSLTNVGVKERTETFDRLSAVIKDYQRSAADLRATGREANFDEWFQGYLEQQKIDQLNLQQEKYNYLLLKDVKDILKQSNTSLSSLSEEELEDIAKSSIALSIEQKQRELQVIQQNKDIIKLNKDATVQEIKNTKELIESRKFDPTKPIIEGGFKSVGKDLDKIIENTKPRSLLKIVLDLMGPFGAVINFFIKLVVTPLMFSLGLLAGFFMVQHEKFKRLGALLSGSVFVDMINAFVLVKNSLVFVFKELPLIISSFITGWSKKTATLYDGISKTGRFFSFIANKSEGFFFLWVRLTDAFSRMFSVIGNTRFFMAISGFFSTVVNLLTPIKSIGVAMLSGAQLISRGVSSVMTPLTTFFSSGIGKVVLLLDKFGFGLGTIFRFAVGIGRWLGGIFAPLTSIITVLKDLPIVVKGIFSGNFYTMMKSIMGLIVQIGGMVLATIFGGPIGAVAAAMVLKLENILKWFDPIFDFLIYLGGLVFGAIWAIYEDFVAPTLEAISKVIVSVLNLAFGLLKPVFKILQFVLILLAPLVALIVLVFKGLGYVFKGIGMLADALTTYVIDPIFKFMEDFLFKFIQPVYDWIADTWIGKMLGMETKKDRELREAKEKAERQKAKEKEEEQKKKKDDKKTTFGFDTASLNEGIGKTRKVVTETVDKSVDFIKTTVSGLGINISNLGETIRDFSTRLKEILIPLTAGLVNMSQSLGTKAIHLGEAGLQQLNRPEVRGAFSAATTPIKYTTATEMKPAYSPGASEVSQDISAFVNAMKEQNKQTGGAMVNNQQTTVVNNTNSGPIMTMPSNSERTANQINSSVRPPG